MSERSENASQLRLLPSRDPAGRPDWMLDDRTRRAGRRGVAEARAILRRAQPPGVKPDAGRPAAERPALERPAAQRKAS